ncbi:ornithine-acyl-ACP acyltransferase [Paraburkholderia strydomiana]|nr:ornithine-acyl-ACP acyltransferase [Paraburkholderia strydomiana]
MGSDSRPYPGVSLKALWANCEEDVREAQRLRHRVFMQDQGARPDSAAADGAGLDVDRFDQFCDHLLVRAVDESSGALGPVVGTYRLLTASAARRAGGFYADTEFDLGPIQKLRARAVELGRACVHSRWRSGSVIMALWGALGHYMSSHRLDTMIGCASVSLNTNREHPARLWQSLRKDYLAAPRWRVQPIIALPMEFQEADFPSLSGTRFPTNTPPLIKGYLRCGVRLLGPPAFDAAFNTADLPMMLQVADLSHRYRKRFLGK